MHLKIFDLPTLENTNSDAFEGKNKKEILVVVNLEDHKKYPELLVKMLSALKINLSEDCLLLKTNHEGEYSFAKISSKHAIKKVYLLGVTINQLGIQSKDITNQVLQFENVEILKTFSLEEISNNQNSKRILWNAMQTFFKNE